MKVAHIKIADEGWILERCAAEISKYCQSVTFGKSEDPQANIQYYVNYSAYRSRVSPIEIGYFTHSEIDQNARDRYFSAAHAMDHCVCHSRRYADELLADGVANVSVIPPGVDLEAFRPKVRIGVVGRTYHTGRKGEGLVSQVLDVQGIEWRFTGSGWPRESTRVLDGEMPDFYNGLDYVLIPALYEGGPMSVLEGLACGKPIIASDVGWVPDFPHISFETGNALSLRGVLERLVAEREKLREPVLAYSWENWARRHAKLFERLSNALPARRSQSETTLHSHPVLVSHGPEDTSRGGPSIRIPKTVDALRAIGVEARHYGQPLEDYQDVSTAHVFNIWQPESCTKTLISARQAGLATVLSPIFLNLTTHNLYSDTVPSIYRTTEPDLLAQALAPVAKQLAQEENLPISEPYEGFHAEVRNCTSMADHLILLSEHEKRCLEHIGALTQPFSMVTNPVDWTQFDCVSPELFREQFGLGDYVLCVGRIETRKNQALVAAACRRLGRTAVFIGHEGEGRYAALVRQIAGPAAVFVPRLSWSDPLLPSAFLGASVFCLPSWAEGAPLAALEAGAAGTPLVLSDRSSEVEYFGTYARYINPADLDGACAAIEAAWMDTAREERSQFVRKNHGFERYARVTASVYENVSRPINRSVLPYLQASSIYIDVTDYVHSRGQSIGIGKVQEQFYLASRERKTHTFVPVCWAYGTNRFHCLTDDEVQDRTTADKLRERNDDDPSVLTNRKTSSADAFFSASGAWVSDHSYHEALAALTFKTKLSLNLVVHDLARHDLAHLYTPEETNRFRRRLRDLTARVDRIFVYSDATASSLGLFMRQSPEIGLGMSRFELGITSASCRDESGLQAEHLSKLSNRPFVLFVGSVEPRKNHILLLNAWKLMIAGDADDPPLLVFTGAPRAAQDTLNFWLSCNSDVAGHVLHIEDATDETVRWLYEKCEFTLFPSLYEGWGLPVSESLLHGKICLASDRSSIREIEPDLTELLDPFDVSLWAQRVQYWNGNPTARAAKEKKILDNYVRPKWSDSVDSVVATLDATGSRRVRWHIALDTLILVGADALQFEMMGPPIGFHKIESTGVWTSAPTACLKFGVPSHANSNLWLTLEVRTLVENDVAISINDNAPQSFRVSPVGKVITFPISGQEASGTEALVVVLSVETLHAPKDLHPPMNEDARRLGIFLVGFGVFTSPETATEAWRNSAAAPKSNGKVSRLPPSWKTSFKATLRKSRLIK